MTTPHLKIACNSIAGIADVTGIPFDEILTELTGSIFDAEEAGEITEYMESL